ncbi:MAG: DUF4911 domain-containing protein [Fusobacteriaceae bacterium]|jgi:hypothetical protein|nr:DUF4911 domain-containing protein [Fusobacteriaceae bacterium]
MESYEFLIQSRRDDIDFINKIIEAYEGVGLIRTLDPQKGIINLIVTNDFKDVAREIIKDLNQNHVTAEIIEERPWQGNLY